MMKLLICLWLSLSVYAFGDTYYIDAENGNDLNSGTSEIEAWKTITRVNSARFLPGDIVSFKRGSVWREQLNIMSVSDEGNSIKINSYGEGNKPIISGADIISGFVNYSGNIWVAPFASMPQQVYVNNIRGAKCDNINMLTEQGNWYYSNSEKQLYIYITGDLSLSLIEAASRAYSIYIGGRNIIAEDIQVEKTNNNGIKIAPDAENVIVSNIDFFQWSVNYDGENAGIEASGRNIEIKNCTFGKNSGNEIADENWAGFEGISVKGTNISIHDNNIFHNSTENENPRGLFANGIFLENFSGTIRVYNNYIYHTGSHGIRISGYSNRADSVLIYNNIIEYPGQAGVSAYKTRAGDGIGATGLVYGNKISYANRLGGDVGANGSQSCGIHMNDGVIENTEPGNPFIKWYVYENIVFNNQAPADSGSEDSGGIIADFNANNMEIFRNLIFDNWGKGISIWNANKCKVYYNIVYGNDAGLIVSAANGSQETADNNQVFNNTFYKNFNGNDKGSNINSEIFFGKNGHNNRIQNNIFYAANEGFVYFFDTTNTSDISLDNNVIFKDIENSICYDSKNYNQTFDKWRTNHLEWDINSIHQNPAIDITSENFEINPNSPAINNGLDFGQLLDFKKHPIVGKPDIGAIEYSSVTGIKGETLPAGFILYQNYPNPFNPSTVIKFNLALKSFVTLKVYDLLGNELSTLINEEKPAGLTEVGYNASGLSSGVYFYTLTAGNFSQTRKFILLK